MTPDEMPHFGAKVRWTMGAHELIYVFAVCGDCAKREGLNRASRSESREIKARKIPIERSGLTVKAIGAYHACEACGELTFYLVTVNTSEEPEDATIPEQRPPF